MTTCPIDDAAETSRVKARERVTLLPEADAQQVR